MSCLLSYVRTHALRAEMRSYAARAEARDDLAAEACFSILHVSACSARGLCYSIGKQKQWRRAACGKSEVRVLPRTTRKEGGYHG